MSTKLPMRHLAKLLVSTSSNTLKWYCDHLTLLFFLSDFESLFTKHSLCEILGLKFEKKTVYLNYNFPI